MIKKKYSEFNKSKHGSYKILPHATPYLKIEKKKITSPKFVFRKSLEILNKEFKKNIENKKILDIGSANGELIYFLQKKLNKNNLFHGIDVYKPFVKISKKLNNFNNCSFEVSSIFKIKKRYDVVFCICTAQIFPDITPLLGKIIDLLNKKGVAILTGRFNENKVDAIIKFKDHTLDKWRCDFNIHSQDTINKFFFKYKKKIKWKFEKHYIDVTIPKKKKNPDIYHYTFKDINKNIRITSGLLQLHDNVFLVIKKLN